MEPNANSQTTGTCPVCHQSVLPSYYFCPNCGAKLREAPLSTSALAQIWIYLFSIILPPMCFLFVSKWPGMKYVRSRDAKTRQIGQAAWFLLILSTILTIWFAVVWTQNYIKETVDSINTDLSGYGA